MQPLALPLNPVRRHAWLACLLIGAVGCGSVTAATSIGDATRDLEEAQGLEAEKNAPYEYTRADALLTKSKELRGRGKYEQAADFARQSQAASEKAVDVARLAQDRTKRREKFAPKAKEDRSKGEPRTEEPRKEEPRRGPPAFTPSGDD
jgi:hypothetical protein